MMWVNDLKDLLDMIVSLNGYFGIEPRLPVRVDVSSEANTELTGMSHGMRTLSVYSIPCFIDSTLLGREFNLYLAYDPYTPIFVGGAF